MNVLNKLNIVGFNTQGLKSNISYISSLIKEFNIVFICEHWLSKAEKFVLEDMCKESHTLLFNTAEKSPSGRPFQGNCFLVDRILAPHIEIIHKDARVFAFKLCSASFPLLVIGTYLTSYHNKASLEEYNEQLNLMATLIRMNSECEPIIIGDFQSFPDGLYDGLDRNNCKRNPLSKRLSDFIQNNMLELVDVTRGHGPTTTYQHLTLMNSSYIDHIAMRLDSDLMVSECKVHEKQGTNTSDHCAVSVHIKTDINLNDIIAEDLPKSAIPRRYWKNDKFKVNYYRAVEKFIENLPVDDTSDSSVIHLSQILLNSAAEAAENTFNKNIKPCSFSKKWWTPQLSDAKRVLSTHFMSWKEAGFPKDGGQIHCRYLLARKNFRKQVKYAQNQLITKKYITIDKLKNTHPQRFWNKMHTLRKDDSNRKYAINNKNTDEEIANEFADHFSTLLNQPRTKITPSPVAHLNRTPFNPSTEDPITITSIDIDSTLNCLKLNKTTDPMNITAEHLIFAENEKMKIWLRNFFNNIFDKGEVSALLSTSKMIPLVKSLKKSLKEAGNYRGISIIPILTKMLEYIIMEKCPSLLETHGLQFGFKNQSSTNHAEFMISETLKFYNSKKSPVYMCSLDAEKAFDSCNWDLLFNKLIERGTPLRVVNILSCLYKNGTSNVSYNGKLSESFCLSQGVRQGSILSPYLYNIYTELLLETLEKESKVGTNLYGIFTGIIMYADDIILLSPTLSGLRELLNQCISYSEKHGLAMNPEKTEFLISGRTNGTEQLIFNHWVVSPSSSLKHLGFLWSSKNFTHTATVESENVCQRINKFWQVIFSLVKSGIRYCAPHTIAQLFRSLAVPTMTYGLELCNLDSELLGKLDREARSGLKSLFDVSKYSKNYLNPLLHIENISRVIQRNKINLFYRLVTNTTTRTVVMNLLTTKHNYLSFVDDALSVCHHMDFDVREILFLGKSPLIKKAFPPIPSQVEQELNFCIKYWHVQPLRAYFKNKMEERVVRNAVYDQ